MDEFPIMNFPHDPPRGCGVRGSWGWVGFGFGCGCGCGFWGWFWLWGSGDVFWVWGAGSYARLHGRLYRPSLGRPLSVYANAMAEGRKIMFEGYEIMFEGSEILPFKHLEYL